MAAAIPAAIGAGSSIFGSISQKGAQKNQQKMVQEQMEMLRPFLQQQMDMSTMSMDAVSRNLNPLLASLGQASPEANALGDSLISLFDPAWQEALAQNNQLYGQGQGLLSTGQNIMNSSLGYLGDAAQGMKQVQNFARPFMTAGNRAIDQFLPSAQRTWENIAPEVGNINSSYGAMSRTLADLAPRGGGRITSMAKADMDRQKQINDQFFASRQATQDKGLNAAFQGANTQLGASNAFRDLFQAGTGTGLNTIGAGLSTIGAGANQLATKGGLAQGLLSQGMAAKNLGLNSQQILAGLLGNLTQGPNAGANTLSGLYNGQANRALASSQQSQGTGLGGYLVDLFQSSPMQNGLNGLFKKITGGGTKTSSTNPFVNETGGGWMG